MEVYLEIIYILNGIVLAFTFEILFFLLNIQIDLKKLFQYVLTYNISLVLLYIDFHTGFTLFYYLLISVIYFKKQVYIYYPLFIFIYISVITFINHYINTSTIYQGILIIETLDSSMIIIFALFLLTIIYFYIVYIKNKIHTTLTSVVFNQISLKALIDTGNTVYYKGYPVIFIKRKYLRDYRVLETISVNSITGIQDIEIIKIKNIKINNIDFYNVYSGIMDEGEYECILNTQLLGGML